MDTKGDLNQHIWGVQSPVDVRHPRHCIPHACVYVLTRDGKAMLSPKYHKGPYRVGCISIDCLALAASVPLLCRPNVDWGVVCKQSRHATVWVTSRMAGER